MDTPHVKLSIIHCMTGPVYLLVASDGGGRLGVEHRQSLAVVDARHPQEVEKDARKFAELLGLPFVLETEDRRPPPASPELPAETLTRCGVAECVDRTWHFTFGRSYYFRKGEGIERDRRFVWHDDQERPAWVDMSEINFREAFRVKAPAP